MRARHGAFVFYGPPGSGKSEQGAATFQDSFALLSAPTNLAFFEARMESGYYEKKGRPKVPPRRVVVVDTAVAYEQNADGTRTLFQMGAVDPASGMLMSIPQRATYDSILASIVAAAFRDVQQHGRVVSFSNVLLDEGGTMNRRVFDEVRPYCLTKDNKPDVFKAFAIASDWIGSWWDRLRQLTNFGVNVCMIAHDKDPDQAREKVGGPQLTSQDAMKRICADAHGVLYRAVEDAPLDMSFLTAPKGEDPKQQTEALLAAIAQQKQQPSRYRWRAHASEWHLSKLRGLESVDFESIRDLDGDQVLERAGIIAYAPGPRPSAMIPSGATTHK